MRKSKTGYLIPLYSRFLWGFAKLFEEKKNGDYCKDYC